jgi:YidC/Oxa1 family membrane protein insertase
MNQKTMELYQEYGVNPMAGCLPLLIQFPIMIALYQGLRAFVPSQPEFYNFLWIPDLGSIDETHIMVVLVAVSTFIQSYISTGKPTQPMQWYMLIAMPVMMGWMAAKFPAFLCIYWITITVVGIFQQLIINKPMRKKLQERAAELEEERKQKSANRGNTSKHKKAEKPEKAEKIDKYEEADKSAETKVAENADGEAAKKRRRRRR